MQVLVNVLVMPTEMMLLMSFCVFFLVCAKVSTSQISSGLNLNNIL